MPLAFISGCSGTALNADEISFFNDSRPFGLILFDRNCETPGQVSRLTKAFREIVEHDDAPVLIDQEGGRVQRLKPPHWPAMPPAEVIGRLYDQNEEKGREAVRRLGRILAGELVSLGINVNCMPLLDVPVKGSHDVIGSRAFSTDADVIIDAARLFCQGLMEAGCLPVIKHIPGHGRAGCDSHKKLPVVETLRNELEVSDFKPFRALKSHLFAMTAHVVFSDIDPDHPATTSRAVIAQIIRSHIEFKGLLMSDDLSMEALSGSIGQRASDAFAAGCDLALHCNGDLAEMQEVASEAPELGESALEMYAIARKQCGRISQKDDLERYRELVAGLGEHDVSGA